MKQPELGKKIAELRKTKRLTQEELVEKCNISIRTIQRIESGEVTPRDYTVKTILAALEFDLDQISYSTPSNYQESTDPFRKFFLLGVEPSLRYANTHLNIALGAGIFYFILRFVEGIMDFSRYNEDMFASEATYALVKGILLITLIFFMRGFVIIGSLFENNLLRIIGTVMIGANIVVIGLDIYSLFNYAFEVEMLVMIYGFTSGPLGFVFGVSLIRLPKSMGLMPKLAGGIEIAAAAFTVTIFLGFIGSFMLIPAELLEILILYKAIEVLRKTETIHSA